MPKKSTPSRQEGRTPKLVDVRESSDGKAAHQAIRHVAEDKSAPVTSDTRDRAKKGGKQLGTLAATDARYPALRPYTLPVDSGQMAIISTDIVTPEKVEEIVRSRAGAIIDTDYDRVSVYVNSESSGGGVSSVSIGETSDSDAYVGEVYAPTRQVLICDPCYAFDDNFSASSEPTGGYYDALCRTSIANKFGTLTNDAENRAAVVSTAHGDGSYDTDYHEFGEHGDPFRGYKVKVTFEDNWDDEDEDWDDEDEDDDG